MTLVFVAKGMTVSNPVGYVNINPLPDGLPQGLVRAHLLRTNLQQVQLNLVDGGMTNFQETFDGEGTPADMEYRENSVRTTHGRVGWRDDDYEIDYNVGYTWLAVAKYPPDDDPTLPLRSFLVTTVGYGGVGGGDGEEFRFSGENFGRFMLRRAGEGEGVFFGAGGIMEAGNYYAVFGGLDVVGAEKGVAQVYQPHLENLQTREHLFSMSRISDLQGILVARSIGWSTSTDRPVKTEMAFFAAWDRPLSQQEMQSAYLLLKPWLLSRGVEIA